MSRRPATRQRVAGLPMRSPKHPPAMTGPARWPSCVRRRIWSRNSRLSVNLAASRQDEEHSVRAVSIALVSVLCAAMISPASADNDKNKGQGRDNPNMGRGAGDGPQGQQIVIYDRDRDTVRSWYRNEYAAGRCPPGLAKKNNG